MFPLAAKPKSNKHTDRARKSSTTWFFKATKTATRKFQQIRQQFGLGRYHIFEFTFMRVSSHPDSQSGECTSAVNKQTLQALKVTWKGVRHGPLSAREACGAAHQKVVCRSKFEF